MNFFSELTYSMYADGELPAEEARRVETHLAGCSGCRALMEALQVENRFLVEALQEPDEEAVPVAARPVRPLDILWTGLGVLAAAAGLRALLGWAEEMRPPAAVDWLNPFSLTAQLNLFFSSVFYFIREGVAMLVSSLTTVSFLVFGLLVVAGGVLWLWRRPAMVAMLATLALVLGLALPGAAVETHTARRAAFVVAKGHTIDDTLLFRGETLIIDGVVTGNVIAFAERVEINGTVKGDVITFAGIELINGTVEGNVYSFVQRVEVNGTVGGSLHAFAQRVAVGSAGRVERDVLAFAGKVEVDGAVARDIVASAGMVGVGGDLGRNLVAHAGQVRLRGRARVGGDLKVWVKKEENLQVDSGAIVVGTTETKIKEAAPSRFTRPKFYLWQGMWLAAAFVTGLLLYWLFPALFKTRLETGGAVVRTVGLGFLALVATPVAALVAGITVIGLPLALLGVLTLAVGIYLAKSLVGVFVGRALRRSFGGQPAQFALDLLVGLVVLAVATHIPYVGWFVTLLVVLLGLGIAVSNARRSWQRTELT